jgi:hypothetical protein
MGIPDPSPNLGPARADIAERVRVLRRLGKYREADELQRQAAAQPEAARNGASGLPRSGEPDAVRDQRSEPRRFSEDEQAAKPESRGD